MFVTNRKSIWQIILLCFALLHFSCDSNLFHDGMKEGVIHYKISYPQIPDDNYILDLLPKEMTTTFAQDGFKSDIIAGMGLFKTSVIFDEASDKLTHSVKLLNKRYASKLNLEDIKSLNPDFENISMTHTGNTKEIAGLNCKEVLVEMTGDSSWKFKLYYTEEIALKAPNRHTPFKEIPGILMEYELVNYDTHMRFTALNIEEQEVTDEHLELEDNYEMVSPKRLNDEMTAIFANVQ